MTITNDNNNCITVGNECTGCMACVNVCPRGCIITVADKEGFLYPSINMEDCINCGLCLKMCQSCKEYKKRAISKGYIALGREYFDSSSGGVFFELAKEIINENGYVAGCIVDDTFKVKHILTNRVEDIKKMCGSKYVQSDITMIFKDIKKLVNEGKTVLFAGTPCQCSAISSFVGSKTNSLYLVDLVCHGVPAPLMWERYIYQKCKKNNISLRNVFFREKNKYERTVYKLILDGVNKSITIPGNKDPFLLQFIKENTYRESCYSCKYSNDRRVGDLTIGDCASWKYYLNFYPHLATSSVFVNSKKGEKLWNKCIEAKRIDYCEMDYSREIRMNQALHRCSVRTQTRDDFYKDYYTMSEREFEKKYTEKNLNIFLLIKYVIKRIVPTETREKIRKKIVKVINK